MATNAADMLQRDGMGKLRTVLAKYRDQAAKSGDRSSISMADVLKQAGMSPTDFYSITSMDGRLPDELLQQYQQAVEGLLSATYQDGTRSSKSVGDSLADFIEYQQDGLQKLASAYQTLADPNASSLDKSKAKMWVNQLSKTNLGDKHDKQSPFTQYRDAGGAAWLNQDTPVGAMSPDEEASYLDDPEQLADSMDDFLVSDKVDQRGSTFRENVKGIEYYDTPTRERASVAEIDPRTVAEDELLSHLGLERTVSEDELIDPTIADEIQSKWQDQDFVNSIDRTGEGAMRSSLDYFDQLIANDGRDAVSDAYMNRMTNEAERLRKANVDAALANLDARGMGGSGMELQAYLQGAGQSMQAQFDAAMEAAAMAQQRKDAAAEQRAVQGEAMQMLQDGRAKTMAEAIDLATRDRAQMRWATEKENANTATSAADQTFGWQTEAAKSDADKHTSANDQNFQWEGTKAVKDADLWDAAAGDQFKTDSAETFRRNANLEDVEGKVFATGVAGTIQDAATTERVRAGDRAVTEAGKAASVDQGNTAEGLRLDAEKLKALLEADDPNGWDIAAGVIDALQGGSEAAVNLSKLGGK